MQANTHNPITFGASSAMVCDNTHLHLKMYRDNIDSKP